MVLPRSVSGTIGPPSRRGSGELLKAAIEEALTWHSSRRFQPLLEGDWLGMIYHSLLQHMPDATRIHLQTRVEGLDKPHFDIAIGPSGSYYVTPQTVAEVKFIARAYPDQQCDRNYQEAEHRDIPKLKLVKSVCDDVSLLIFDERDWYGRSRFRPTGKTKLETLRSLAAPDGITVNYYPLRP